MKIVVCGAGGFIGHHLVKRLKNDGHTVIGIDRKYPEFERSPADVFNIWDLRKPGFESMLDEADEVYQLAAEMGGAGYVFTGEHDAEIMHSSVTINLNVLEACCRCMEADKYDRVFFSSSACVYESLNPAITYAGEADACAEADAYPANPDSDYGWEKLFSERLYQAYARQYGMTVRIGRFHNVFGPLGAWNNGREKFPAAVCRKVAEAPHGTSIQLWGCGDQQRSFMYIDDAVEGMIRLMRSGCDLPMNLGSSRMISITEVARMVIAMSQKWLDITYTEGPEGVQARNSDNTLIKELLGWEPVYPLESGLFATYQWIQEQVYKERAKQLDKPLHSS